MIVNGTALLAAAPIKEMVHGKVHEHGVSWGLGEVGYDIRIKQDIKFWSDGKGRINVSEPNKDTEYGDGKFVIASSMEEFMMPDDLCGIVHDKSTWARRGLSVFNTVIEPGWRGFLTLELVYHGRQPLVLPAGCGIAQVIFHKLAQPSVYEGKYQDQNDHPVAAIFT